MYYRITDEFQFECGQIKRSIIHYSYRMIDETIDAMAFDASTAQSVVKNVLRGPLRRPDSSIHPTESVSKDPQ